MVKAQSIIVIYDSSVFLISFSGSPFEILVSASITTPNVKARLCICQGWWHTAKKRKKESRSICPIIIIWILPSPESNILFFLICIHITFFQSYIPQREFFPTCLTMVVVVLLKHVKNQAKKSNTQKGERSKMYLSHWEHTWESGKRAKEPLTKQIPLRWVPTKELPSMWEIVPFPDIYFLVLIFF